MVHAERGFREMTRLTDPFKIVGPATIAFSGGRTSAYMLWRVLQSYGGTLPTDIVPCFANTGKERPETLDFVQECSDRWNVKVNWLEWRAGEPGFEIVSHNSASRNGEPFAALIRKKRYLPNAVTRFCTVELKIRTQAKFVRETFGFDRWTNAVGFRADEMRRVDNLCGRNAAGKERFSAVAPLAAAGITKPDVMAFWAAQPFDLNLKGHEGNCDLCFLKRRDKLREIMWDRPDLAPWWIDMERVAREEFKAQSDGDAWTGGGFRPPGRPDYARLHATRSKQEEFGLEEPDALDLCYCGDAA
jgi:3'-phosphoadenosine 5'-phosphosulfate sulfotransferase (PAPS reductase)/FAD synthetase